MSDVRDAAQAVLIELDIIRKHREATGVGYLVVHIDTHEALRAALSGVPEGAATPSLEDVLRWVFAQYATVPEHGGPRVVVLGFADEAAAIIAAKMRQFGVPEGAAHVHDWHERQQGAGRYCPGCDTMEWFGVPEGAASDLTAARVVPFLRSVVASGERLTSDDVDAIAAALRSVPSPEPLDVERLAQALHAMPHHYRGGADNDLARMACQQMSPSACEHKAASIAREYARLAAPQPVPEDER